MTGGNMLGNHDNDADDDDDDETKRICARETSVSTAVLSKIQ